MIDHIPHHVVDATGFYNCQCHQETPTMSEDHSITSKKSSFSLFSIFSSSRIRGATDSERRGPSLQRETNQPPEVAKQEDANILRAKILVALIIILAASAVGASTYLLVKDQEKKDFENQFASYASEILTLSRQKADQFFSALDAFSISIASQAISENELRNTSWPFYAISDWSVKARGLAELTGVFDPDVLFFSIVQPEERDIFNEFAMQAVPKWYQESVEVEETEMTATEFWQKTNPFIHFYDPENNSQPDPSPGESDFIPLLQLYPLRLHPGYAIMPTLSDIAQSPGSGALVNMSRSIRKPVLGFTMVNVGTDAATPGSLIIQPIYDTVHSSAEDRKVVAFAGIRLRWLDYFKNVLTDGEFGVTVVLKSSCPNLSTFDKHDDGSASSVLTYRIDGQNAELLGISDLHNPKYDDMESTDVFVDLNIDQSEVPEGTCIPTLTLHVYPSGDLEESFQTYHAIEYTGVVAASFIFTSLVFLLYDYFVRRRQAKVMERIMRQDEIVANVFPTAIRNRLYQSQERQGKAHRGKHAEHGDLKTGFEAPEFEEGPYISGSAPMADLFPNVSVVFADIVGFTAWSSAREPHQVFVLLETIYCAFDKIAYRHNVFKVETVGDCYVSVVGLPEPVDKHAVVACSFARECKIKMIELTLKLEVSLGPGTGDLDLRTGIHSGQVTAGVLRGERSRFQLFGDTMNTAARMEQTGEPHRVHLSQASADLLNEAGLGRWIMPRSTKIFVKGKGQMQTYWLRRKKAGKPKSRSDKITVAETEETEEESDSMEDNLLAFSVSKDQGMTKIERLVEWNVEVLGKLLQQIIASRDGDVNDIESLSDTERSIGRDGGTVLDEFTPIIPLKRFEVGDLRARRRPSSIDIGDKAKSQLRSYLSEIAGMYRENSFHNFDHASHVTASVKKMLARIVKVDGEENGFAANSGIQRVNNDRHLDDLVTHGYGITSDPLTQFAVVFSAVIHDVDHPGVPNAQLLKEKTRNAEIYKKSVAEQNSVELAWDLLMSDEYSSLRACIYQTESDLRRFRQLVVNTVMATDIVDKELQAPRKNRWDAAFSNESPPSTENDDDRKATIVIEHLIQASDVSHTMQHWHIYKEWNERFFMECYGAYKAGRADLDPSVGWYKGEIGFFDYYVIPLAKKLDRCGVFGVSSDEYLNYAKANRDEWAREGKALVEEYVSKYNSSQ
eukprot:scaffold5563_cov94-Cylindrotheca_fusiformis.AAC.2